MTKKIILSFFISFIFLGCSKTVVKPIESKKVSHLNIQWNIKSTSSMNIIDKTLSKEQNKKQFNHRIQSAVVDIEKNFIPKITQNNFLTISPNYKKIDDNKSLYLQIKLSGYGSIKNKWKTILIGTGIVEGVVQGVIVSSVTQNPWLGVGVATEEMTSEYLTWNGADWLLGETYAPVTIEGNLIYKNKTIWEDSFFVTENEDELNENEKKDKSKQLIASLHKAENELLESLNTYLKKEILNIKE